MDLEAHFAKESERGQFSGSVLALLANDEDVDLGQIGRRALREALDVG